MSTAEAATTTNPTDQITGERLGWRGIVAHGLLQRGHSHREVQRICKLSSHSVVAISKNKIFASYDDFIPAFERIEKAMLKAGYAEELFLASEDKSASRRSQLLTNAEKWRKLEAPQTQADGLTAADILAVIGARRATVISRTTTQQVVVEADLPEPIDVTPRNSEGEPSCARTDQGASEEKDAEKPAKVSGRKRGRGTLPPPPPS